jgi:1-acyl-sn-glycerol-3-phosphate acyltransferase
MKSTKATVAEIKTYSLKMGTWYRVLRGAIGLLLRILARIEIKGRERIPDEGPYVLIINHLHWLDAPVLAVVFPYRAYVFAASKWEKRFLLGALFRSMDAIFVRRGEVDRKALRQALGVLKGGGVLGMAPEGTRSKTGGLQRGRSGAAYLAMHTGVPVQPVVITGQEKVFSELRRLRRPTIHVQYGHPFDPPTVEGRTTTEDVHAFSEEIMYRLAAMLPPEYRGVYADIEEARPEYLVALADGQV